ncbi:hypothetical protein [Ottowia thiooxydans]|uniref:DUF4145 domain-containing protein n=1 Tax=Ottowia thiooxydans TaxID=219182 RepID=A0ABV2Q6I9_9BURK
MSAVARFNSKSQLGMTVGMAQYPFAPRANEDGTQRLETEAEFRERVIACLEYFDQRDRVERAERHIWLGKHRVSVNGVYWERSETSGVMREACSSYAHGNFIATLVLSLAYVEHVVNDALPPLPVGRRTPTMATAIKQARSAGLFPDELLDGAAVLSEFRNPFIHRRDQGDPDTIGQRVKSRKIHPSIILETDARDALQIMYGFFRYSFDPPLNP